MNAPQVDVIARVFSCWPEIVGSDLACHCGPAAVSGDNLVVVADDPVWASELQWLEKELLERLAETTGTSRFRAVTVRVKPHRSRPSRW